MSNTLAAKILLLSVVAVSSSLTVYLNGQKTTRKNFSVPLTSMRAKVIAVILKLNLPYLMNYIPSNSIARLSTLLFKNIYTTITIPLPFTKKLTLYPTGKGIPSFTLCFPSALLMMSKERKNELLATFFNIQCAKILPLLLSNDESTERLKIANGLINLF